MKNNDYVKKEIIQIIHGYFYGKVEGNIEIDFGHGQINGYFKGDLELDEGTSAYIKRIVFSKELV